ncbi:TMEM175 family protein [Chitinophaga nivalis]|uniref:TMEM175 family protein n=1 Tax=Chitinophaga nivalis TaxID=2991709 RepID=A0ABT3INS0_9BACT|nr:TMEM175 family protein [Chitinophaga nivalis]MCW3464680.1 TMEM175 family protein [Chitinophaga nivalis]MCW3485629.1 TMEM175 family protein [Chitinophaga nivalis]
MSMSVIKESKPAHREFELERLILFSDAVFAIAITLLIIEIKLPHIPANTPVANYGEIFKPLIGEFIAFAASFMFIGNFWVRHLQLCRFLQNYNEGLIIRNLLFLFFIVAFPFSASAMMEVSVHFMLPLFIYLCNLAGCMATLFLLSYYIFQRNPNLTIPGHATEKELLYQRYKYNFLTMATGFTVIAMVYFMFPENLMYQRISYFIIPVLALFNHFRIKIKKRNTLRLVHKGDKNN